MKGAHGIVGGLDEPQARGAVTPSRALIVEGGPGTGKTEVLLRRACHLVRSLGAPAGDVLVICVSEARAEGARRRLRVLFEGAAVVPRVETVSSLARRIVARLSPGTSPPRIASRYREWCLLRALPAASGTGPGLAAEMIRLFGTLRRHLVDPVAVGHALERLGASGGAVPEELGLAGRLYRGEDEALREAGLLAASGLAARAARLLEGAGEARAAAFPWGFVLMDDLHEADPAARILLGAMARCVASRAEGGGGRGGGVVATLDPLHDPYGEGPGRERGLARIVSPAGPAACVIRLGSGHRCPAALLEVAARAHALFRPPGTEPDPLPPPAPPPAPGARGVVELVEEDSASSEAFFVARRVRELLATGLRPGEIAILCRSPARSASPFEMALRGYGIPYRLAGGSGLFRSPMVHLVLDYLRVLEDPSAEEPLTRILQSAPLGLDLLGVSRILRETRRAGIPLAVGVHRFQDRLDAAGRGRLRAFWRELDRLARRVRLDPLGGVLLGIYRLGGIAAALVSPGEPGGAQDAANLRKLHGMAEDYAAQHPGLSPGAFLADLDLAAEILHDEPEAGTREWMDESVEILSPHQARGRGFRVVFLTGLSDGRFPAGIASPPLLPFDRMAPLVRELGLSPPPWPGTLGDHLASERRLFTLAATRASECLVLTRSRRGGGAGGGGGGGGGRDQAPSPFFTAAREGGLPLLEAPYGKGQARLAPGDVTTAFDLEFFLRRALAAREDRHDRARAVVERFPEIDLDYIRGERTYEESGDPVELPREIRLPVTSLRDFLRCPRRFFYARVLELERPESHPAGLGTFVHGILEEFHRRHPSLEGGDREVLRREFREILVRRWEEEEDRFASRLEAEVVRGTCEGMIDAYLEAEGAHSHGRRSEGFEERIHFELDGVRLTAKIDRIDVTEEGIEVIDYKTSRSARRPKEEALKKQFYNQDEREDWRPLDLQLPLYGLALEEGRGVLPRALTIHYVLGKRRGRWRPDRARLEIRDDAGKKAIRPVELRRVRRTAGEVLARIRAGRFPAEPVQASECRSCDFRTVCPRGGGGHG